MKRSELRPNPEKVREWQRRTRERARERERERAQGGARTAGLARKPPKRRATLPPEARARAVATVDGWCVACLDRERLLPYARPLRSGARRLYSAGRIRRAVHIHHILPVQKWPELELVEENWLPLCWECHDLHERAIVRVRLTALPDVAVKLADRVGDSATYYLERTYS